jgi:hypothetical protein
VVPDFLRKSMEFFMNNTNNTSSLLVYTVFKEIVSRDSNVLFLFHWIDIKFALGPDQVYFSL